MLFLRNKCFLLLFQDILPPTEAAWEDTTSDILLIEFESSSAGAQFDFGANTPVVWEEKKEQMHSDALYVLCGVVRRW